jgi:nucleotide-binding universal stress UspA family protein
VFNSIVVALDLGTAADRAAPVAGALARRGGLPIELLTVVPPTESAGLRSADLDERARALGLASHRSLVVEGDDPGAVIARRYGAATAPCS